MVGTVLFSAIVSKFATNNPMLGLWFTIILSCVGVGYLSITYFDYAVMAGSSVIGSYLFIRGASVFLGGFPNEFILYQNYKNGAVGSVQKTFFLYFLAMLFIAFTSFGIQMKMRSGNEGQYSVRKEAKYSKV
jgi:exosortase/archaeosortase